MNAIQKAQQYVGKYLERDSEEWYVALAQGRSGVWGINAVQGLYDMPLIAIESPYAGCAVIYDGWAGVVTELLPDGFRAIDFGTSDTYSGDQRGYRVRQVFRPYNSEWIKSFAEPRKVQVPEKPKRVKIVEQKKGFTDAPQSESLAVKSQSTEDKNNV